MGLDNKIDRLRKEDTSHYADPDMDLTKSNGRMQFVENGQTAIARITLQTEKGIENMRKVLQDWRIDMSEEPADDGTVFVVKNASPAQLQKLQSGLGANRAAMKISFPKAGDETKKDSKADYEVAAVHNPISLWLTKTRCEKAEAIAKELGLEPVIGKEKDGKFKFELSGPQPTLAVWRDRLNGKEEIETPQKTAKPKNASYEPPEMDLTSAAAFRDQLVKKYPAKAEAPAPKAKRGLFSWLKNPFKNKPAAPAKAKPKKKS